MSLKLVHIYDLGDFETSPTNETCDELVFCLKDDSCWDTHFFGERFGERRSAVGLCFRFLFSLLIVGVIFVIIAEVQGRKKQFKVFKRIVGKVKLAIGDTIDGLNSSFRLRKDHEMGSHDGDKVNANWTEEEKQESAFVLTQRTTSNFIKNNIDPTMALPLKYPAEYTPRRVDNTVLPVSGFFFADLWDLAVACNLLISVFLGSAGWAMICSAFSSFLWILVDYERTCIKDESYVEQWINDVGQSLTDIRDDYDFYPVFLLIGYTGYVVMRWREFMVNCHECQNKIHDVALLCGGACNAPPNKRIRRKLYRIYRYLNVVHALTFKNVSPTVGPISIEIDFVRFLNLLEVDEADECILMGNKQRDAVIGWLTCEIAELLQMEGVRPRFVEDRLARALAEVRGLVARHHDLFVRDNPNFYLDLMLLVVNALLFLVIISYPFSLIVHSDRNLMVVPCFQPIVMIGVFVVVASFRTAFSLLSRLRNPFSWTRDRIKIDSILASTDHAIFVLLRANFRTQPFDKNDDRRSTWIKNSTLEKKARARKAGQTLRTSSSEIGTGIEAF
jgi:Bestrophin, RFP-TM, chloride channel